MAAALLPKKRARSAERAAPERPEPERVELPDGALFRCIYAGSAGDKTPGLEKGIEIFLRGKVRPGELVQIIEFNDANTEKNPFAEQPIYQTVKKLIKKLGYKTPPDNEKQVYSLFELKEWDRETGENLIKALQKPATICIVVGGNTWRLSCAFNRNPGVRDIIYSMVDRGHLMYVSFSAGTVFLGSSVEICRDELQDVLDEGGKMVKDGLKLVNFAMRPHNQSIESQKAGQNFASKVENNKIRTDRGMRITRANGGEIKYLQDGEAWLQLGKEWHFLSDDCVKRGECNCNVDLKHTTGNKIKRPTR